MLIHHDSRNYEEAASEAARFARGKLEKLIDDGRARAAAVLEHVAASQPRDRVAHARVLRFGADESGSLVVDVGDHGRDGLHRHALQQAAARVDLPWAYVQHLAEQQLPGKQERDGASVEVLTPAQWARELVAHNLNELYRHVDARFLLRAVGGEVRGFLSDRYRRLDSRPIVEAYARACSDLGAVPVEGYVTETKIAIKAVLPRVFEPVPNEVLVYGVVLENSDFGNGALSLRTFILRLWCTNFAIGEESLRQVHLGRRIGDDFAFSDRTYRLDTAANASAVRDLVGENLSPRAIGKLQDAIRKANEDKIDPHKVGERLRKVLNKTEVEQVVATFNSPDVENLPPGNTTWRLSNALSWVARKLGDAERKLDLMKIAGSVVTAA